GQAARQNDSRWAEVEQKAHGLGVERRGHRTDVQIAGQVLLAQPQQQIDVGDDQRVNAHLFGKPASEFEHERKLLRRVIRRVERDEDRQLELTRVVNQ